MSANHWAAASVAGFRVESCAAETEASRSVRNTALRWQRIFIRTSTIDAFPYANDVMDSVAIMSELGTAVQRRSVRQAFCIESSMQWSRSWRVMTLVLWSAVLMAG